MKASDALAKLLSYKKVNYGFELIGGMIAHIVDSINLLGETKLLSVHHEQAAAFAAGGVARATNNEILGVALGTSGPGATNLVTGIADCWLDNIPCVFITGQVNVSESKGNRQIRQQGFQELDSVKIVESITKYAVKIENVKDLLPEINKAIDLAREGRPGPVLIDIPMNIQREEVDEQQLIELLSKENNASFVQSDSLKEKDDINTICEMLLKAKKPLVLFGGGGVKNKQLNHFIDTLKLLKIPYAASLKGCENIPEDTFYLGMIGSYGTRVSNYAIQNSDFLLVIGSRLDVRQTGSDCSDFARNASVVQVDIDPHQLNNRIVADKSLHMDAQSFYQAFIKETKNKKATNESLRSGWLNELQTKKELHHCNEYHDLKLSPFAIFSLINEKFKNMSVQYTCDVGNNQMWAAHTIKLGPKQQMHHSGGLGAMGFSIPTSIGVQIASSLPVVSFSGDGGAQLNIQELDIISRENLPILTIVLNNKALGMVKNFQEMYFDGRDDSTYWRRYSCDFVQIAQGYNMKSYRAQNIEELNSAIDNFLSHLRPIFLEIDIEFVNECRPRLSFGDKLDNQSPTLGVIT